MYWDEKFHNSLVVCMELKKILGLREMSSEIGTSFILKSSHPKNLSFLKWILQSSVFFFYFIITIIIIIIFFFFFFFFDLNKSIYY